MRPIASMLPRAARRLAGAAILGLALAGTAAAPAAAQGFAPELRGAWVLGSCEAPAVLIHVGQRSVARFPEQGPVRLHLYDRFAAAEGWTVAIGRSTTHPRLLYRRDGEALHEATPDDKTRDDALPGPNPRLAELRRCARLPLALGALHAEAEPAISAYERIEAACRDGTLDPCVRAAFAQADISRDSRLSPAEVGRLARAAVQVAMLLHGSTAQELAAATAATAMLTLAVARAVVLTYDYDNDGTLSLAEIWPEAVPPAAVPPGGPGSLAPSALPALVQEIITHAQALRGLVDLLGLPLPGSGGSRSGGRSREK